MFCTLKEETSTDRKFRVFAVIDPSSESFCQPFKKKSAWLLVIIFH